ncbi:hypothetical protein P7C73_g519, partial [Tremellales sp. Uapishka_1]
MAPQPRVFLDFAIADQPIGRVVFELFKNAVPKTAENFRALCTGELGLSKASGIPLHYKSSIIHRVIENFMIQGGDFTKRTGAGGESIYGGMFEDERLSGEGTEVDKAGLLVMANRGPNTNGSQFFVTLDKADHLTGKHVVFGRVVSGMEHIITIGHLPTDEKDRPLSRVVISNSGELEFRKPAKKARTPSPSPSRSRSRSASAVSGASTPAKKTRRDSVGDSDSEQDERRKRKERKRREKREKREKKEKKEKKPREETEEELDARLEREEKEQLEVVRLEKLAEMKKQLEADRQRIKDSGGVIFKGRGAMRYLDPEAVRNRNIPRNYDARQQDTRTRRPPPQGRPMDDGDKWKRGQAPSFEGLDKEMDKYRRASRRDVDEEPRTEVRIRRQSPPARKRSASPVVRARERSVSVERNQSPPRRERSLARSDSGSDMSLDRED